MQERLIFLLLAGIFLSNASFAQDHIRYGLKGGISLSTLTGKERKYKPGLQAGGVIMLGANEPLFFQSELLFTQKGSWSWRRNEREVFGLYYLDMPVMLGMEIFENLLLHGGFQPSVLIAGFYRSNAQEDERRGGYIGRELTRFDYSTLIGAEYHFKEKYFIGIRYTHGFVPIFEHGARLDDRGRLPVNRSFEFYSGYMLR